MKKYKIAKRFYILITILATLLLLVCIYSIAQTENKKQEKISALKNSNNYVIEYVEYGDTLWKICNNNLPFGIDIRDYIEIVKQYNNINNVIQAKQKIKLPQ